MSEAIRVSVGKLVEFACRSGDLVANAPGGPSAAEGIRAHQKLQKQFAAEFKAEVSVGAQLEQDGYQVELSGRVDLLQADANPPIIAEIKSCYGDPSRLPIEQTALHWAQLKIYGYCYLREFPAGSIVLRMIWYDVPGKRSQQESQEFSWAQLEDFCTTALGTYLRWQRLIAQLDSDGRESARDCAFPFAEFRPGQRAMAESIYRTVRDTGQLLCEAPTGTGKTVSALFPAIKALGANLIDKVVYLTAKNSGRQMASDTLAAMRQNGLRTSVLVLQAKARACACLNGGCNLDAQDRCPLGIGFFDRLPQAREQLMRSGDMSIDALGAVAHTHQLCAFELSLQMLPWATLVICDYNYVFDPLVNLGYFRETTDRVALLVDEAHNLVDRSRQMYSAELLRSASLLAAAECKTSNPQLGKSVAGITRALDRIHSAMQSDETVGDAPPDTLSRAVERLLDELARQALEGTRPPRAMGEWLKTIYRYRQIVELFGNHHRCIGRAVQRGKNRQIDIKLACLNASTALAQSYSCFHGVVMFSATLRPQAFFRDALGLQHDVPCLSLPSPFAAEHLACFACASIDTRYQQRANSIAPIADVISAVYRAKPGNYLVFFPSYHYLQQVAATLAAQHPHLPLLCQERDSSEATRTEFLQQFAQGRQTLGLAIMGGIYGEGIDYCGDRLIGAIVVGVGLPGMDIEQELIREDFNAAGLPGFDFAYSFPGLNRVLQAAGRVIRSASDRGIVVLADQRFTQARYRQLLPEHWPLQICHTQEQLAAGLEQFWSTQAD